MFEVAGSGRLIRGSSGATISYDSDEVGPFVVKQGDLRVTAQGLWMLENPSDALPRILEVDHDGAYRMERLTPVPIDLLDVHTTLLEVFRRLEKHIWSQRSVVSYNRTLHDKKMKSLNNNTSKIEQRLLWQLHSAVDWFDLQDCLTHGDPTIDNVMLRNGEIVLIDPIPATPAIPDLRAVDLGKMIQSYVGYEMYRYQMKGPRHGERLSEFLDIICVDSNEKAAALYFAVVHFVRAHPYMDDDTNRRLREYCLPIIEEAAVPWTR